MNFTNNLDFEEFIEDIQNVLEKKGVNLVPKTPSYWGKVEQAYTRCYKTPFSFALHIHAKLFSVIDQESLQTLIHQINTQPPNIITITEYCPNTDQNREIYESIKQFLSSIKSN